MLHLRRDTIKSLITTNGNVTVQEMVERFGVTPETVRRDLAYLEKCGVLRRVHGGATAIRPYGDEPAYNYRMEHNRDEKHAIAECASKLVQDGDTVFITHGTTTLEVARYLRGHSRLTIITNSIDIASEFVNCAGVDTYCLGGHLRYGELSLTGMLAEQTARMFNANKLILGIGGINPQIGITDYHMVEIELFKAYLQASQCVIGVADHSKFGVIATCNVCPISSLTHLVTDWGTPKEQYEPYQEMGVHVHVAKRTNIHD